MKPTKEQKKLLLQSLSDTINNLHNTAAQLEEAEGLAPEYKHALVESYEKRAKEYEELYRFVSTYL